jgi:solute carrier family 36 (proton-coupled amino acid transporter)
MPNERSPLLVSQGSTDDGIREIPSSTSSSSFEEIHDADLLSSPGSASVLQTMVNLAKTCMGTGCLALPFAAQQGGVLLSVAGIILIALWNVFSAKRLLDCLHLIMEDQNESNNSRQLRMTKAPPPIGTATLGKVAWYTGGPYALAVLDVMTVLLLFGIITAYQDAMQSFISDTPLSLGPTADAMVIASIMAPLSIVKNLGYLSRISALGLSVLLGTFLVIAGYGLVQYEPTVTPFKLQWLPLDGLTGASHWFGCVVFGFGIVPLTFNFHESMKEPHKLVGAATIAMLAVAASYIIIGIGLLILYPNIEGDVLHELPQNGLLPVVTRLAMTLVVLVTAPLLIVPCGELIEGKMSPQPTMKLKGIVRFSICFITVVISLSVPGFVYVLSFVGCFCVGKTTSSS